MADSRRVVWDEHNLQDNKQYFDTHPVTKPIDEPKTPYEPEKAMDEEGNFVNSDDEHLKVAKNPRQYDYHGNEIRVADDAQQWDEETKSFARRARAEAPVVSSPASASGPAMSFNNHANDHDSSPDQSDFKKRRVQHGLVLPPAPTEHERVSQEEAQHHAEFEHMRKAVYADEGAKFKEQLRLAKLQAEADEE
eukprot:GILI01019511.1.p1 GENE.GILI01019511.1~~GILI01019511.1.p1  ORF type:complete len:193 (-),score=43.80 GILI01019511.1:77-655(-)